MNLYVFWLCLLLGLGNLAGCSSGQGQGETESQAAKATPAIDRDALKRAVITRIADDHHFNAADVTEFSAEVADLGAQGGNTTAAFRLKGSFSVDAASPSNVYEAATQHVNANICMVAPEHCQGAHFRHTVQFDVTARVLTALDGSAKLLVDGPVTVDGRQPAGAQPSSTPVAKTETATPPPPAALPTAPLSGPTVAASIVSRPAPVYPPQAIRQGHEGTVMLRVMLSASGQLMDVDVDTTSGYRELDKAAETAALNWRFTPETRGGVGVTSRFRVPVTFSLNRQPAPGTSGRPAPGPGVSQDRTSGSDDGATRPSFDCARAATPTEQAICASPELSALDARMASAYRRRLQMTPDQSDETKQAQRAFIREREARCVGDARCIKGMMSSRLRELL